MGVVGVSILCALTPLLLYYFVPLGPLLLGKRQSLPDRHDSAPPSLVITNTTSAKSNENQSITLNDLPNSNALESMTSNSPSAAASTSDADRMPPPPIPTSSSLQQQRLLPSAKSTHRVPSNGPLPNRNPASASGSKSLVPPQTRPSVTTPNNPNRSTTAASSLNPGTTSSTPRQKVLLSPGHSPLDWAALTRSGRNLSGVSSPQKVTPSQLAWHNGRQGRPAWAAWRGQVYNITEYLPFHPGGQGELMRAAGKYGEVVEKLFLEVHPWVSWESMLGACWVGRLVEEPPQ